MGGELVNLDNQDMRDGTNSWSGDAVRLGGVPRLRSWVSKTWGSSGVPFVEGRRAVGLLTVDADDCSKEGTMSESRGPASAHHPGGWSVTVGASLLDV